eukprot:4848498-Amphidinium_carterae.1
MHQGVLSNFGGKGGHTLERVGGGLFWGTKIFKFTLCSSRWPAKQASRKGVGICSWESAG